MLPLAFLALAVAPIFLAFQGAPNPAESLLFALSLAPAGAAVVVVSSGRLVLGHLVVALGFAGIALVCFAGLRAGSGVATTWLVAAQLEAVASRDRRLARAGALAVGTMLALVIVLSQDVRFAPAASCAGTALLAGLAALLAGLTMSRRTPNADGASAAGEAYRRDLEAALDATLPHLEAAGAILAVSRSGAARSAPADYELLGRRLAERESRECPTEPLHIVAQTDADPPLSFAATSQDLRTPLNAIIGFSEILASRTTRPHDVAKQCELARTINRSGLDILATIDAALDPSRSRSLTSPLAPPPPTGSFSSPIVKDAA